jgi:hypothetical protein
MVSFDRFRPDVTDHEERVRIVFEFAAMMTKNISTFIGPPINLEFEKVYVGYVLISKKRYFGYKKEKLNEPAKLESKGDSSVRRSNPKFHRDLIRSLQRIFLDLAIGRDITLRDKLFETVTLELQRALDGKITVDEFSRTCQLKQHYTTPQAQSVVRDKIRERAPGSEPQVGDRVRFAMAMPKDTKAPAYSMAECSTYMEEHKIPLAVHYYIRTIRTSVEQLFEITKMDMKRIGSIFDQAETHANDQLNRQMHLDTFGFFESSVKQNQYVIRDNLDLDRTPRTKDKVRDDERKRKINAQLREKNEDFLQVKHVKRFLGIEERHSTEKTEIKKKKTSQHKTSKSVTKLRDLRSIFSSTREA